MSLKIICYYSFYHNIIIIFYIILLIYSIINQWRMCVILQIFKNTCLSSSMEVNFQSDLSYQGAYFSYKYLNWVETIINNSSSGKLESQ